MSVSDWLVVILLAPLVITLGYLVVYAVLVVVMTVAVLIDQAIESLKGGSK